MSPVEAFVCGVLTVLAMDLVAVLIALWTGRRR